MKEVFFREQERDERGPLEPGDFLATRLALGKVGMDVGFAGRKFRKIVRDGDREKGKEALTDEKAGRAGIAKDVKIVVQIGEEKVKKGLRRMSRGIKEYGSGLEKGLGGW